MQTIRRLKAFHGTENDGDAQPELPFEMVDKIYSYSEALSLCILSMTCKKMLIRRPNEKDLDAAIRLRAGKRLCDRLNTYAGGLAYAIMDVLQDDKIYLAGEFLFNCFSNSIKVDTIDIIIRISMTQGSALPSLFAMSEVIKKMQIAFDNISQSCYLESEEKPSEDLKWMGVARCCLLRLNDLKFRILVMNSHDFLRDCELDIYCMLKRLYRFSLFECSLGGDSFTGNKLSDKMKKIGKTRNNLFESRMDELEQEYDNYDSLSEGYTFKRLKEENKCMMRQVRTSLSVTADRYKALGYHIEEK